MKHDSLCPCAPIDPIRPGAVHTSNSASCLCVLIAKVRADERAKILPSPADVRGEEHVDYCRDLYCGGCYEFGEDE